MLSSRDKVTAGESFQPSARVHNELVQASQMLEQLSLPNRKQNPPKEALEVYVQSSSDIGAGVVVGFGAPEIIATDASTAMQGTILSHATPAAGQWAVARRGILAGTSGPCVLTGIAWAQVNITDASHTHAEIDSGNLVSAESGYAKILYKPAGTGTDWCCLYLGCCGSEGSGSGSGSCACGSMEATALLLQQLDLDGTVAKDDISAIRTNLLQSMQTCDCVTSISCANCQTLRAPQTMLVDISGVTDVAFGGGASEPDFTLDPISDVMNAQHSFTMSCTGFTSPIITGTVEYTLSNIPIGPGGIGGTQDMTVRLILQFSEIIANVHRWRLTYEVDDEVSTIDQYVVQGQALTNPDCWSPENTWTVVSGTTDHIDVSAWSVVSRPQF